MKDFFFAIFEKNFKKIAKVLQIKNTNQGNSLNLIKILPEFCVTCDRKPGSLQVKIMELKRTLGGKKAKLKIILYFDCPQNWEC